VDRGDGGQVGGGLLSDRGDIKCYGRVDCVVSAAQGVFLAY